MARPRKDGKPPRAVNKRKLSPLYVTRKNLPAGLVWDTDQKGLALSVQPTGHRSYKLIYNFHNRLRWYTIADATAIGLADARKIARRLMVQVAEGRDPQAEKKAERKAGTFEQLAEKYVAEWAMKHNKSYKQAQTLVQRYVLPRLGRLAPANISRADVKALIAKIEAPVLANQVLASASAIFSWAIKQEIVTLNPCRLIDRNATKSRERILSDSEIPKFWAALGKHGLAGTALKVILLTGQRPGEVSHMRREHVQDGWWELPGKPVKGWPGTKNGATHRVWLAEQARELIVQTQDGDYTLGRRGGPIDQLDAVMRTICADLKLTDKVTPHDLRRTFSSKVTALGFGRDAMNRVTNHKEGGIADVYDRHEYAEENRRIMEEVATHIIALAEGKPVPSNVEQFKKAM